MQRTMPEEGIPCDQIYSVPTTGTPTLTRISTGLGRTTCSYYLPGDSLILYATTHLATDSCPPGVDRAKIKKYVWSIYDTYDIVVADLKGNIVRRLTDTPGYDAEATVSPKGDRIVFTSTRDGDLDLYTMNLDGSDVKRITTGLGYDGGAFFSPDGSKLVFRASRPQTPEAQQEYKDLLAQGLVAPSDMEVYVCNADGTDLRQITSLGKANWAPFFHPSGQKIIFASNHTSASGRQFNLWMINLDGTGLEQVTYDQDFDAFAMFSPDGKKLVFASNRNNGETRSTNVFIADWID
jgi:Tol biopolymer transport system component